MIDLLPEHLEQVREILRRLVPDLRVIVFGSRVSGGAKPFSDLDLMLVSEKPLDWRLLCELRLAFSESDLPLVVDLLDRNDLSEAMVCLLERQGVILQ